MIQNFGLLPGGEAAHLYSICSGGITAGRLGIPPPQPFPAVPAAGSVSVASNVSPNLI